MNFAGEHVKNRDRMKKEKRRINVKSTSFFRLPQLHVWWCCIDRSFVILKDEILLIFLLWIHSIDEFLFCFRL